MKFMYLKNNVWLFFWVLIFSGSNLKRGRKKNHRFGYLMYIFEIISYVRGIYSGQFAELGKGKKSASKKRGKKVSQ